MQWQASQRSMLVVLKIEEPQFLVVFDRSWEQATVCVRWVSASESINDRVLRQAGRGVERSNLVVAVTVRWNDGCLHARHQTLPIRPVAGANDGMHLLRDTSPEK